MLMPKRCRPTRLISLATVPTLTGYFSGQTGYGYRSFEAFIDAVRQIEAGAAKPEVGAVTVAITVNESFEVFVMICLLRPCLVSLGCILSVLQRVPVSCCQV